MSEEKLLFDLMEVDDIIPYEMKLKEIKNRKLLSGFFTNKLLTLEKNSDDNTRENIMLMMIDIDIDINSDNLGYFNVLYCDYLDIQNNLSLKYLDLLTQLLNTDTISNDHNMTVDDLRNANLNLDYTMSELLYIKDNLLTQERYNLLVIIQEKIDELNNLINNDDEL